MQGFHDIFRARATSLRKNLLTAAVLVALAYAVLFILVNGQIDVPFLYSNPGN